jgi:hypothetical protein
MLQEGWTPLHLASRFGQVQVAKELLAAGADMTLLDKVTPLPPYMPPTYVQMCKCSFRRIPYCIVVNIIVVGHNAVRHLAAHAGIHSKRLHDWMTRIQLRGSSSDTTVQILLLLLANEPMPCLKNNTLSLCDAAGWLDPPACSRKFGEVGGGQGADECRGTLGCARQGVATPLQLGRTVRGSSVVTTFLV